MKLTLVDRLLRRQLGRLIEDVRAATPITRELAPRPLGLREPNTD